MIDVDESTFQREVLDASRQLPVLVDFWAPWCAPCRALGPLLERLEQGSAGRFKLVKVNSDANAQLAARYQVRSIPCVIAFVDAQPVDAFVGALPEGQLREFIARITPDPAEQTRRKARRLMEDGDLDAAAASLRAALALDPASSAAQLDLAELLLERMAPPFDARLAEAAQALSAVAAAERANPRWRALDTRLASLRSAASLPPVPSLQARIAADPGDVAARLQLAQQLIVQRIFGAALEQLLEVAARDRAFGDDAARRLMLGVFDLAADQPQLVAAYRRRLSALINR
jgi:putative thioredoxin